MIFDKRNSASSNVNFIRIGNDEMQWSEWEIDKAVKEGYSISGWIFKAINLISKNMITAPFVIKNKDNEIEWEHPTTKLLLNPHPYLSRIQFYELLVQWLQLSGDAFIKKADSTNATIELWPITPDKIMPIESNDNSTFVDGYKTKNSGGVFVRDPTLTTDNIIQLSLTNPAQPLNGISPLQVAAKSVDTDVAQQTWNAAAMQNRGVVEGVFTFKENLDKTQFDNILKRIIDKFSGALNARKPLVIGSQASYTRMSLTSTEMDFLNSRKFNRDEIFVIFGVPPQLGGSEESSTYDNFSSSMRIFWETTIIPLLNLISTAFNNSFQDQIGEGYYVSYDLSDVSALRDNEKDKADISKVYFDMGVPFSQINAKFEIGFEEYEGWDLSYNGKSERKEIENKNEERSLKLISFENRSAKSETEKKRKIADGPAADAFAKVLKDQGDAVYKALEKSEDPIEAVKSFHDDMLSVVTNVTVSVASQFANTVVVDSRGDALNFQKRGSLEDELIEKFLEEENYLLGEVLDIQESAIQIILDQVRNASENGYSVEELRKALDDTGIFSPERAARIARTEVGTAASIGQISAAEMAGADYKTWETAGARTREAHQNRSGEEVGIDERFSQQISLVGPRFPLDPQISASDRINCDCFMTFRVD